MAEPSLVARCVRAMRDAVPDRLPVTVKCRIGIDDQDGEGDFQAFVDTVHGDGGCTSFAVHARKAWLEGLSPKENREVPPLNYPRVYRLKETRPNLTVILNGGIATLEEAEAHLAHVDGVMLGRAAYQTPYILSEVDQRFFSKAKEPVTRANALRALLPYACEHVERGGRLNNIARHILGLMHGMRGARAFRRHLSENAVVDGADTDILETAIEMAEAAEAWPA